MKTFFIALIAYLLTYATAFSQLLVGPELGVNYSWTTFKDDELKERFGMKPVVGFHAGGHIAFRVRKRFFLHTSVLYATKGRVLTGKFDSMLKNKTTYSYIDMPINYTVDFKGRIGKSKEFKYFLGIGPNISYWLGGKGTFFSSELEENNEDAFSYKINFTSSDDDESPEEMKVKNSNRLQLGLNVIGGMVFEPWYKTRFIFSVRYELGHSYLAKADGSFSGIYYEDPLKSRNQGFRISLSYLVDLKTEERKKGKSTIDKRNPK